MKWKQITAFILSAFLTISLCAPPNGTLSVNVAAAESSDVIFSEEGMTGEKSLTEEPAGSSMDGSTFDESSEEAPMGSGSDETAGTGEDGEYEEEQAPTDDITMPEADVSESFSSESEDQGSDSYDEAGVHGADSFDTSIPAEEESAYDETTEVDSSVSDEDTASDDTTSPIDQETEDSSFSSEDEGAEDSSFESTDEAGSNDSSASEDGTAGDVESPDMSEVSDTSVDSETTQEGAEGADASDDQNVTYEYGDDVVVGFEDLGDDVVINLDHKIALFELERQFPTQLGLRVGGTVHYQNSEEGTLIPIKAEDYHIQYIDVSWECVEDYNDSLDYFHFVPKLEGYSMAEALVMPEITVSIGGTLEIPPLIEFEFDEDDGHEVPIVDMQTSGGMKKGRGVIPASYNAFEAGRLPEVRDQYPYGTCFVHSAIGAIETDLITDGNADRDTIDLSELHLIYHFYHGYYDEKNCNDGDVVISSNNYLDNGGDKWLASSVLANMVGPVLEKDAPYSQAADYSPQASDSRGLNAAQLTGVYKLRCKDEDENEDKRAKDAVKNAILAHGGVCASIYALGSYPNDYYDDESGSYYYPTEESTNHAVILVGWDDNFSRNSFKAGTPEGDGAWLVRNSWGDNHYSYHGYFWLSYYDKGLDEIVLAMDAQPWTYDHCYSYKSIPRSAYYPMDPGYVSGTQVFHIDEKEEIGAVGIETRNGNLNVEISLECSGKTVTTSTATSAEGYYLINLDEPLKVEEPSDVTVTVTYSGDGNAEGILYYPVEYKGETFNLGEISYTPNCASGGLILTDSNGSFNTGADGCIRLFTMDYTPSQQGDQKDISTLEVTLSEQSYIYDGNEKNPAVTVKDGANLLEEGVDFSVEYRDNINAGTAAVILTGLGDYEGSREETFIISKADPVLLFAQAEMKKSLTDAAFINTLSCTTDGAVTFSSSNTAVASVNSSTGQVTIKGTGSTTITANAGEGNNYNAGSASYSLTVSALSLSDCTMTISPTSYTYDGTEKKPTVTIKNNGTSLTVNTDYTVSYTNNINAGTGKVTATGKGSYSGTLSKTFTIGKASPTLSFASTSVSKTTTDSAFTNTLTKKTDGTITFSSSNTSVATVNSSSGLVTIKGAGSTTITANASAGANYNAGSASYSLTVTALSLSDCTMTISPTSYTYDGSEKKPTVTIKNNGTNLTANTDYTVSYTNNINAGTGKVTTTGKGSYSGTLSKTFTIGKASPTLSFASTSVSKTTADSAFTNTLTKKTDGTITFSSSNTSVATVNSSSGLVTIKGAGSTTITANAAEGTNYNAGTASYALTVKDNSPSVIQSGKCGDNLTWTLDEEGTLIISGKGKMWDFSDYYRNPAPWNDFTNSIKTIIIESGVTLISKDAFRDCSSLISVQIPEGVTKIDSGAFSNCDSLTSVTIPKGVTSIGERAFLYCYHLTSVTIPKGVTSIGDGAFEHCFRLKSVVIPEGVTTINDYTFADCDSLTSVTIPKGVTSIGNSVFYQCSSLTNVNIPERVTSIGDSAFFRCSSLTSITIPYSVTYIENDAFLGCSLTSITIPYSVTYIGDDAFTECDNLTIRGYIGTVAEKYANDNNIPFIGSKKSIKGAVVSGIVSKTYTGKPLTQSPTVKVGSKTLKNGTDYALSYKNNTNTGTATVTITGKGGYKDSLSKTFSITKAAQSITAKAGTSRVAVGKTTTVSITGAKGTKSFKSSNTVIATVTSAGKVTAKKVGTVKITATSAATAQYNAASKTVTIKVVPAATASLTAANQATGIKLTWKKVTGANGYKVYRGSTLIKTITSGSTVTYADTKANTNGTKYTYKVVAKASTGDSTLSKSVSVYRVARPAVPSVTNSASKKMTVKWGKNAKANGYQIQYSTDKTFKSGNKAVTVTGASTVSKVIGSLTKGKTYYVRIRTYKTVGSAKYWSVWSAAKSVKISK